MYEDIAPFHWTSEDSDTIRQNVRDWPANNLADYKAIFCSLATCINAFTRKVLNYWRAGIPSATRPNATLSGDPMYRLFTRTCVRRQNHDDVNEVLQGEEDDGGRVVPVNGASTGDDAVFKCRRGLPANAYGECAHTAVWGPGANAASPGRHRPLSRALRAVEDALLPGYHPPPPKYLVDAPSGDTLNTPATPGIIRTSIRSAHANIRSALACTSIISSEAPGRQNRVSSPSRTTKAATFSKGVDSHVCTMAYIVAYSNHGVVAYPVFIRHQHQHHTECFIQERSCPPANHGYSVSELPDSDCPSQLLISDRDFEPPNSAVQVQNEVLLDHQSSSELEWVRMGGEGGLVVEGGRRGLLGKGTMDADPSSPLELARILETALLVFEDSSYGSLHPWTASGLRLQRPVPQKHNSHTTAHGLGRLSTSECGAVDKQGREKREIPEKTRRPAASSCTIPTSEIPVAAPPGIEPDLPRWEASSLTTTAPGPLHLDIDVRGHLCVLGKGFHLANEPPSAGGRRPRKVEFFFSPPLRWGEQVASAAKCALPTLGLLPTYPLATSIGTPFRLSALGCRENSLVIWRYSRSTFSAVESMILARIFARDLWSAAITDVRGLNPGPGRSTTVSWSTPHSFPYFFTAFKRARLTSQCQPRGHKSSRLGSEVFVIPEGDIGWDATMKQRRNVMVEKTGDPRENPTTGGVVLHDPHMLIEASSPCKESSHHSPGVMSANRGKLKLEQPDWELNQDPSECKPECLPLSHFAQGVTSTAPVFVFKVIQDHGLKVDVVCI
ncbi:hypothetical protein PR048_030368 [Dryococelus australis]|uniref:Uncharacterized protein n=1 Tax=Dryococelus australis TaxID=614101 RepID=A0ABQ9GBH8_9NEOP|nr:hypothetical protein PR048_030368 [Dryococelus australis]